MGMSAIEIKDLTKQFGSLKAVDGISLLIPEGEVFGLLGPNGAGKTTTIKMLSTTLKISSGTAVVNGFDVKSQPSQVRKSIGIVFQDPAIDIELTGKENLDFHARMYGMSGNERTKRIKDVLAMVDLSDKADLLVKTYSGGMKRRLEIARGLMHYPKVLFLDEPTLGLDAQTRRAIWEHIQRITKQEKITIILTTHYMEEADFLCKQVAIIDKGKILTTGTPKQLKTSLGSDIIMLKTGKGKALASLLSKQKWVAKAKVSDGHVHISLKDGETRIPAIMKMAEKKNIPVLSVELHKPTLEDVFIRFTGRTIREEADAKQMLRMQARMRGMR